MKSGSEIEMNENLNYCAWKVILERIHKSCPCTGNLQSSMMLKRRKTSRTTHEQAIPDIHQPYFVDSMNLHPLFQQPQMVPIRELQIYRAFLSPDTLHSTLTPSHSLQIFYSLPSYHIDISSVPVTSCFDFGPPFSFHRA